MPQAAAAATHLVLPKLDWLDTVVYANCGYVLADELLFTVPEHQSSVLSPSQAPSSCRGIACHTLFTAMQAWSLCCAAGEPHSGRHRPFYQAGLSSSHVSHGYDFDAHDSASGNAAAMMAGALLCPHLRTSSPDHITNTLSALIMRFRLLQMLLCVSQ